MKTPPAQTTALFQQALALSNRGELSRAHAMCEAILQADPKDSRALQLLGIIAARSGNFAGAVRYFRRSSDFDPNNPITLCLRGAAHQALKQWELALASFGQAIDVKADFAIALLGRGDALQHLKQWELALESYTQAIAARPDFAEAHLHRGVVLKNMMHWQAAIASYGRAIEINPNLAAAHSNLGEALNELCQWEAALVSCKQAIAIRPNFAEAYSNLGNALKGLNRWEEALASYDQAIAIKPDFAEAYSNRGAVLRDLRRCDEALASLDRALAIRSDYGQARFNRSVILLLIGDFERGWIEFEARWKNKYALYDKEERSFSQPLWLGTGSIADKTILLHGEQGLGDTLQFCRYAKLVENRGARVILEVQEPLAELLADLDGVAEVVARGSALPTFDYRCPLLSLPLAFNTALDNIPAASKYLHADATRIARWQARLGVKTKPRIGLAWSGNPTNMNDRNRSIPLAELIRHLPVNFQYFCLQKDVRASDQPALDSHFDSQSVFDDMSFPETAALCECMDLVVSVDTSIAHLSAALGKTTWILLSYTSDWRWLLERDDSPWYSSVRLYRQRMVGEWGPVIERVAADLLQAFA